MYRTPVSKNQEIYPETQDNINLNQTFRRSQRQYPGDLSDRYTANNHNVTSRRLIEELPNNNINSNSSPHSIFEGFSSADRQADINALRQRGQEIFNRPSSNDKTSERHLKIHQLRRELEFLQEEDENETYVNVHHNSYNSRRAREHRISGTSSENIDSDDDTSEEKLSNKKRKNSTKDLNNVAAIEQLAQAMVKAISMKTNDGTKEFIARQSIGRDLPHFDGRPEDWPLFIAQYRNSTKLCKFSNDENMERLRKTLKGEAKEAVHAFLIFPSNVEAVIDRLEQRFGRPDIIIKSLINKTAALPVAREDKPDTIIKLASAVQNLTITIEHLNREDYLYNPTLIEEIQRKFSPIMQMFWTQSIDFKKRVSLREICEWLDKQSQAACFRAHDPVQSNPNRNEFRRSRGRVMTTTINEANLKNQSNGKTEIECPCTKNCSNLATCEKFLQMNIDQRWKCVTQHFTCFSCLLRGHAVNKCRSKKVCGINGCRKPHHKLLHQLDTSANSIMESSSATTHTNACLQAINKNVNFSTMLKIVPVIVENGATLRKCYALLDTGSTISLISSSIAQELNLRGPISPLCIQWGNGDSTSENNAQQVSIKIRGTFKNAKSYTLLGLKTVDNVQLPKQSINREQLIEHWPYLSDIPFESYHNIKPEILIGEDNALMISAREIIHEGNESPIATRTLLGWTISGNNAAETHETSFVYHMCETDNILHDLVKSSFQTDSFGVAVNIEKPRSKDDVRALEILEKTTKRVGDGNRWETGLLWKSDNAMLPDSKPTALKRLHCLEKKLDKDPQLKEKYSAKFSEHIEKGYMKKLTHVDEQSQKLWYLPHFAVFNPKKPNKFRIVFDASAKSEGYSLNDFLMQGPDFLRPLQSILFNFRKGIVAFTADIKEMFHQIKVIPEDLASQLVLWRGNDREREPDIYVLTVVSFGTKCSPSNAIFAKDKNAEQFAANFPDAVHAIKNHHYMDDYLGSATDDASATKLINDVIHVHKAGGFEITNWICSSNNINKQIPQHLRHPAADVALGGDCALERILGIWWNYSIDQFTFKTNFERIEKDILNGVKIPTKRQVLQLVMSIYDPLGMVAHFTVKGRILLRDIWKCGIDWDELLPNNLFNCWKYWLDELQKITIVQVNRCYSKEFLFATDIQLHVFCEASQEAFSAVAYFRTKSSVNDFDVAFVLAKVRVAPIGRVLNIPRLELQAAVLGSRLCRTIKTDHPEITKTFLWTDNKTVLCWINSDAAKYKTFVANRISEINELTLQEEWHWISTEENVADEATRSRTTSQFNQDSRWFNGPAFLKLPEQHWAEKVQVSNYKSTDDIEYVGVTLSQNNYNHSLPDINRFSNWFRLIRTTALVQRYVQHFNKTGPKLRNCAKEYSVTEINYAEMLLIKRAQWEDFRDEIQTIMAGKSISKSSKLFKLNVKLDDDNILRVFGRLENTAIDIAIKNPIVLSPENRFTMLLIDYYHSHKFHHIGSQTVLNELRQRYWILKVKSKLKSIKNKCVTCQKLRIKPEPQLMGQLPDARTISNVPPFTFTGMDYFGPFEIKQGRSLQKVYGVLFTCLSIRAVHLEIASDLTTDACIMAIRRFVCRRRSPNKLFSDNGTNLRGADIELRQCLANLNQSQLHHESAKRGIQWIFNPPASPHMGGCWERLVRSVKTALSTTLTSRNPTSEVLYTVFVEIEHMINSRPLTDVSIDVDDTEALTPNHFLIGTSSGESAPGIFDDKDLMLRKRWRITQRLAEIFWHRWVKEYLPSLTQRTKWFKEGRKICIGDLVIIADNQLPRNCWPRGIITAVFPGKDEQVRVVEVKTKTGVYRRPANKICLLNIMDNDGVVATPGHNTEG